MPDHHDAAPVVLSRASCLRCTKRLVDPDEFKHVCEPVENAKCKDYGPKWGFANMGHPIVTSVLPRSITALTAFVTVCPIERRGSMSRLSKTDGEELGSIRKLVQKT